MSEGELPPIDELIPHCGGSILLDRVLAHDGDSTTARVVVGSRRWLRQRDGSVAPWLAIEYMAQCVAAHEGMLSRANGRTLPLGFLVGVKSLRLGAQRFDRDEELRVCTRRTVGRMLPVRKRSANGSYHLRLSGVGRAPLRSGVAQSRQSTRA